MLAMIWSGPITAPSCRLYIIQKREIRGMTLSEFSSSGMIHQLKPSQRLKPLQHLKPLQPSQRLKPLQRLKPREPINSMKTLLECWSKEN